VRQGRILIDQEAATRLDTELEPGQTVFFEEHKRKYDRSGLNIVYEDNHLVIIDKPSGLLSVASNFEAKETAHAMLKKRYYPKMVYVVHRLDQDTSGLLLFTTHHESFVALKKALKDRNIKRTYLAIVEGKLEGKGTWNSYLYEDESYVVHVTDDAKKGEQAITHYEALNFKSGFTLVRFTLDTGKKNQIRVQAAHAGHPIAGDNKYGAKKSRFKRLCLHATNLELMHPHTNKKLVFASPCPFEL
jgi:tRNA pseudouridine32 synthase/23S rRNA pseudouridine746 synthase/23S rRNA pseudouridine1911/1915/1917 synthase